MTRRHIRFLHGWKHEGLFTEGLLGVRKRGLNHHMGNEGDGDQE